MRDFRQRRDIGDIAQRIANRFRVNRFGTLINQCCKRCRIARICKPCLNTVLRQSMREQIVSTAVQRCRRNDIVTGFGDSLNRVSNRRLTGSQRQRTDTAFQRGDTFFQYIIGRIGNTGINISRDLQVK